MDAPVDPQALSSLSTALEASTANDAGDPRAGGRPESGAQLLAQPGALRGRAWLVLQTRQAERLVKGRHAGAEKPAIIGLLGFASLLRALWHGARVDDPYADWWLLQVDAALTLAAETLAAQELGLAAQLAATSAIELDPAVSVKPVRVLLQFTNPYAYRGAHLLAHYDRLAGTLLTAEHVGLLDRHALERRLQDGARPVRRAYATPLGYRFLGVTRADHEQGTARAVQARAAMGEVPESILRGEARAPLAPAPLSLDRARLPAMGLHPVAATPMPAELGRDEGA